MKPGKRIGRRKFLKDSTTLLGAANGPNTATSEPRAVWPCGKETAVC